MKKQMIWRACVVMALIGLLAAALGPRAVGIVQADTPTELISNGGFEVGQAPWIETSSAGRQLISAGAAHTGSSAARLCGYTACNDAVSQTVTVPSTFTSITLTFWWDVTNADSTCSGAFKALVRTPAGVMITTPFVRCSSTTTNGWAQGSATLTSPLSSYKGQQVQVVFTATDNSTGSASYVLDDVSLAAAGAGTPSATSTPLPTSTSTSTPAPTATRTAVPTAATSPTPAPTATRTPVPTATKTPVPTSTSTASSTTTYGLTSVGASQDTSDSNNIDGSKIQTGSQTATVQSISAYVSAVDAAPNNQYSLAIYTDSNGSPGSLVASASGTLRANSWNALPLSAALQANSSYWLLYNSNGTASGSNDLYYNQASSNLGGWVSPQPYGSWPSSVSNFTLVAAQFSLYVTVTGSGAPVPTATKTAVPTATQTATAVPTSGTSSCPGSTTGCAQAMLSILNQDRTANGVGALTLNLTQTNGTGSCVGSLGHSTAMQQSGSIWHTNANYPAASFPNNICIAYSRAGENVGEASYGNELTDMQQLDSMMMGEAHDAATCASTVNHACNIINPNFHQVGIGVINVNGTTWLTEDFTG